MPSTASRASRVATHLGKVFAHSIEATWSDICPAAWQLAEDSAKHYHHAHPGYKPVKVKLDINGADFGTYNVSVKLNPEYTVKEAR